MSRHHLGRIEAIIAQIQSIDADARETYLSRLKSTEPDLHAEVLRFIENVDEDFLETTSDRIWAAVRQDEDPMGRTIRQYRVEGIVGRGGMGIVYKAFDTRLGRYVALKFLPDRLRTDEDARRRFMREAQSAASLDHPNICSIYAVEETADGIPFIAMALYEGETLRERLSRGALESAEVESILSQTAAGLAAAHEKGLIHRDIKPGNLFLTSGGRVKILDFGIAAVKEEQSTSGNDRMLGTVAYMSPEQSRGEPATELSDIWSLGAVGFEMVTGTSPFHATDSQATIYRIRNDEPGSLPPDTPRRIARVIEKCLRKNPRSRISGAGDIESFLSRTRGLGRIPRRAKMVMAAVIVAALGVGWVLGLFSSGMGRYTETEGPQIHVLPLKGAEVGGEARSLANGIMEDVLASLMRIDGIDVRRGVSTAVDLDTYARIQDARFVLELDVPDAFSSKLVERLYSSRGSGTLWVEEYDLNTHSAMRIRDRILNRVLTEAEVDDQMRTGLIRETDDPVAYEHYLRGLQFLKTRLNFGDAARSFSQATNADPGFASAYAALGRTMALIASTGYVQTQGPETFILARNNARKALDLDPTNGSAHLAMALVQHDYEWNWEAARESFDSAIRYSPGDPEVFHLFASHLAELGELSSAIELQEHAMMLAPEMPIYFANYLELLYLQGRHQRVLDEIGTASRQRRIFPFTSIWHAFAAMDRERYGEAGLAVEAARSRLGSNEPNPLLVAMEGRLHALQGQGARARILADSTRAFSPVLAASVYSILEDDGKALDLIEEGYREKDVYMTFLKVWPDADRLRDSPRFQQIMRDMKLD